MDQDNDIDLDTLLRDIVITEPIASLKAKIRLAAELDKLPPPPSHGELHVEDPHLDGDDDRD